MPGFVYITISSPMDVVSIKIYELKLLYILKKNWTKPDPQQKNIRIKLDALGAFLPEDSYRFVQERYSGRLQKTQAGKKPPEVSQCF